MEQQPFTNIDKERLDVLWGKIRGGGIDAAAQARAARISDLNSAISLLTLQLASGQVEVKRQEQFAAYVMAPTSVFVTSDVNWTTLAGFTVTPEDNTAILTSTFLLRGVSTAMVTLGFFRDGTQIFETSMSTVTGGRRVMVPAIYFDNAAPDAPVDYSLRVKKADASITGSGDADFHVSNVFLGVS